MNFRVNTEEETRKHCIAIMNDPEGHERAFYDRQERYAKMNRKDSYKIPGPPTGHIRSEPSKRPEPEKVYRCEGPGRPMTYEEVRTEL